MAGDLTVDVDEYFANLSEAEQNRIFTNAGAEAIRNGADVNQVVNARRGMYTTADGHQATHEGITRRGVYGRSVSGHQDGRRTSAPVVPRLMPEELQRMARNKDEYLALLRQYRFIR